MTSCGAQDLPILLIYPTVPNYQRRRRLTIRKPARTEPVRALVSYYHILLSLQCGTRAGYSSSVKMCYGLVHIDEL